jgi:Fe-S cluster biogenesis protein NfuA
MDKQSILSRVDSAIEILRPYLHADGGDIEIVGLTDEMILELKPIGACKDCHLIDQTMQNGLIDTLRKEVPEVIEIRLIQ